MANRIRNSNPTPAPEEKRPPRYEDFLKPNPFFWPWMLKYLPTNQRVRDIIVVCFGSLVSFILIVFLTALGANELFSVGTGGLVLTIVHGDALSRNMIAGMNFRRAKEMGGSENGK